MEERQSEHEASNIPELVKCTRCVQKSCPNFDLSCLAMLGQKHHILKVNNFIAYDNIIKLGKASLNMPPLNIKDLPIISKKQLIFQINNNKFPFSFNFSNLYPFIELYPMPKYSNYAHSLMYVPLVPQTPTRQVTNSAIFSFSIDTSSAINKDILRFMNWMIIKAENDQNENY